ncbi:MAG: hypothetical protein HOP13_02910 [Alphaproteobacteria bacterium]|nr:hypothetical protein [Alphaproteobacteria bacterium]
MSRTWVMIAAVALLLLAGAYAFRQYIENQPLSAGIADEVAPATQSAAPAPADVEPAAEPPAPSPEVPGPEHPPAAAGDPPGSATPPPKKNGHSGSKVLSYFQASKTKLDAARAFGFVLLPKEAVTDAERRTQKSFCELMLASLDFMTPEAVASTAQGQVLATYWPVMPSRGSFEIKEAFAMRNCDDLLAWYDHALARKLAANAGVAGLSGPLLITWPSGGDATAVRDPLVVDFSKADHERAKKALLYWFHQLKNRPELWTNRMREGTIRADLADAVNDTAGVVLAVMSGKWESLNTVASP